MAGRKKFGYSTFEGICIWVSSMRLGAHIVIIVSSSLMDGRHMGAALASITFALLESSSEDTHTFSINKLK